MDHPWHFYLMATMYVVAGLMHFIRPGAYMRIMPKYLPRHRLLVYLSGAAEIILGIGLCIPVFKDAAIYGILLMLVIFLLVHVYMLTGEKAQSGIPLWILILRIPLQGALMHWAWLYLQY